MKINFLLRFGPAFRQAGVEMIQQVEHLFTKEEATQGYQFVRQDEVNEFFYIIYKGQVSCLLYINEGVAQNRKIFPDCIRSSQTYIVLDVFKKGDIFGTNAVIGDGKSRFTFEVRSKKAQILKIHRQQFHDCFGGHLGEPTCQLQGISKSMQLWLEMKLQKLSKMTVKEFFSL